MDLDIFSLFQFVSVVLLYNLYVSMFRSNRCGVWNFHLFMFQFISKRFETIESVDVDIFACLSLFQKFYYIIYMFQCFETPVMGSGIFTFLCEFVSKQLKVWTKTFSACLSLFQKFYYIIYMFQCFETPGIGSGIFTFLFFSLFRNN